MDVTDSGGAEQANRCDVMAARDWLRRYQSSLCSKCCGRSIEACIFPDFVEMLVERWHAHEHHCRKLRWGNSWEALNSLLPLVEHYDFRRLMLPNGCEIEVRLQRARTEWTVRRNPQRVMLLPRRCRCRERRSTIEAVGAAMVAAYRATREGRDA